MIIELKLNIEIKMKIKTWHWLGIIFLILLGSHTVCFLWGKTAKICPEIEIPMYEPDTAKLIKIARLESKIKELEIKLTKKPKYEIVYKFDTVKINDRMDTINIPAYIRAWANYYGNK